MSSQADHLEKIHERFTATADVFAQGVRVTRMEEANQVADRVTAGLANVPSALAIDVACGPGTFTRPLAGRVRHAIGVDVTPAMIEKARAEAVRDAVTNIEFICADVYKLPFDDRVAIVDIVVPEGCDATIQNEIERVRDPSHTHTLPVHQFRMLFRDAGMRILSEKLRDNWQHFDAWMKNAGSVPGDATYQRVRSMMELTLNSDTSGFHSRLSDKGGIEFMHAVALLVAEKPE